MAKAGAQPDLVGLAIGSSAVRAAIVRHGQVLLTAEEPLPPGTIVRGNLQRPAELTAACRKLWKDNEIGSRLVNAVWNTPNAQIELLRLPKAESSDDMKKMIRLNYRPNIIPAVTTYMDVGGIERGKMEVMIGAMKPDVVNSYVAALKRAGLNPVATGLSTLAAAQAIYVSANLNADYILVHLGAELTTLAVITQRYLRFLYTIPMGGNDMTAAIANRLSISFEEAETLKIRSGLGDEPVDPTLDKQTFAQIQGTLLQQTDTLLQQISDGLQYYSNANGSRQASGIFLAGGGSRLAGIEDSLHEYLFDVAPFVDVRPRDGLENEPQFDMFIDALGACYSPPLSFLKTPPPEAARTIHIPEMLGDEAISLQVIHDESDEETPKKKSFLPWGNKKEQEEDTRAAVESDGSLEVEHDSVMARQAESRINVPIALLVASALFLLAGWQYSGQLNKNARDLKESALATQITAKQAAQQQNGQLQVSGDPAVVAQVKEVYNQQSHTPLWKPLVNFWPNDTVSWHSFGQNIALTLPGAWPPPQLKSLAAQIGAVSYAIDANPRTGNITMPGRTG